MESSFFSFRYLYCSGNSFTLSRKSRIVSKSDNYAYIYLKETIEGLPENGIKMDIGFSLGIPDDIKKQAGAKFKEHSESYAIRISQEDKSVELFAVTHRGLIYAVSTLKQLAASESLTNMLLFDYPDKSVRGYRVYTPGREFIDKFKQTVDMLVYYKYNAIIIEIGGAMEYKRHPLINEKWIELCREVSGDPEAAHKIQLYTYPWAKDSIHFDNGNGSYITQEEMRDIIDYCRKREIDIYPEVPSLSHSDYILRAYPELNERPEDKHPDSYCPSNSKTYSILFDILDEVADVFEPEYINIGHDEYYTSAKCKLCRDKDPVDLYVNDIIKINDYLKAKGIKAIMWGEKLFENLVGYFDEFNPIAPLGGAANPKKDIPPLFECRGRIPKDITLLNWCWGSSDLNEETDIYSYGYKMLYGNYNALLHDDYRLHSSFVDGGFVSNWGSMEEAYMQRNLQNVALVATAYVFWNESYDTCDRAMLLAKTKKELYSRYKASLGDSIIELEHSIDDNIAYKAFYDGVFIVDNDWHLGDYILKYTDGTAVNLPVIYGYNIRSSNPGCEAKEYLVSVSPENLEAIGAAYPYINNGKVVYKTAYANPYPDKQIKSIDYKRIHKTAISVLNTPTRSYDNINECQIIMQYIKKNQFIKDNSRVYAKRITEDSRTPAFYHRHDYFSVELISEGECIQYLNGKEYLCRPGTVCIMSPLDEHKYNIPSFCVIDYICFVDDILSPELLNTVGIDQYPYITNLSMSVFKKIETYFLELLRELNENKRFSSVNVSCLVNLIITDIIRNSNNDDNIVVHSNRSIRKAIDYIHHHLTEPLTSAGTAQICNITPNHFSKVFKKNMGCTFTDYVIGLRLDYAMRLIKSTSKSISEICYEVGFNSPQYFSETFKKRFGYSPTHYIEKQLNLY